MKNLLLLALISTFAAGAFAQKSETMTIKLYFLNTTNDPNLEDCRDVKPLTRVIPKTVGVARAALEGCTCGKIEIQICTKNTYFL